MGSNSYSDITLPLIKTKVKTVSGLSLQISTKKTSLEAAARQNPSSNPPPGAISRMPRPHPRSCLGSLVYRILKISKPKINFSYENFSQKFLKICKI
jgi:hypothetical protein